MESTLTLVSTAMLTAALALPASPATAAADDPSCTDDRASCAPTGRPRPGLHGESLGADGSLSADTGYGSDQDEPDAGRQPQVAEPRQLGRPAGLPEPRSRNQLSQVSAASAFDWGTPDSSMGHNFDDDQVSGWNKYESAGNGGNGLRRPSQITAQDGVLKIEGTADGTSGGMMGSAVQPKFGRWEVRMKTDKRGQGGSYHPVVALVPHGQDYNAGSGDLDFAETDAGSGEVYCFIHYNGKQDYFKVPIDLEQWHTYAIEIAPSHLTWFVDGKVAMTDTNEGAVTGTPWTLNLQLDANQPGGLAPSTMEVDYFRYYPLTDGEVKTLDGPTPQTGSYP